MSDKETARKWLESRDLGDLSLYWPTNKPIPQIDYESGQAQPTLTQIMAAFAVECTAPAPQLSFEEFQRINKHRCETKFHQCETWLPSGWPLAIAGEAGELCNLIKKIIRGDFTFESKRDEILKELADVVIYCDLMISAMGASTGEVVAAKFDEVSRRVNYTGHVFAEAAATPQVTPTGTYFCFECDDKNRCASAETCHAGHSGYPRRTIEGTSEQAPQELELEEEADGRWLAEFTRFPGAMGYGPTKEEAIWNAAKVLIESEPQVTPTEQRYPNATPYTIRQEDGTWIAHAIAFDLVGTDSQKEKAVKQLRTCLIAQIAFGMKCGLGVSQCFFPAPPEYWQRPCEFMPLPTEEEIAKCKFEGTSEQAPPTEKKL